MTWGWLGEIPRRIGSRGSDSVWNWPSAGELATCRGSWLSKGIIRNEKILNIYIYILCIHDHISKAGARKLCVFDPNFSQEIFKNAIFLQDSQPEEQQIHLAIACLIFGSNWFFNFMHVQKCMYIVYPCVCKLLYIYINNIYMFTHTI